MILLTVGACAAIALSYAYKEKYVSPTDPTIVDVIPLQNNNLFIADTKLGFTTSPGKYKIILTKKSQQKKLISLVSLNEKGYRFPYKNINDYDKHIWLFGCSYSWGWGLNDDEIFTNKTQKNIKTHKIHNYSLPAYGNIHYLIQLKTMLKEEHTPTMAIFMYNYFHPFRNIAAPSRLRNIETLGKDLNHPAGYISNGNKLKIKMIPIKFTEEKDPTVEYAKLITQQIFSEIKTICEQNNITAVIGLQDIAPDDSMISFFKSNNFKLFNMNLDLNKPKMRNYPFDAHPSAKAHSKYAAMLTKHLKQNEIT